MTQDHDWNPFAAPESDCRTDEFVVLDTSADAIRREYLPTENNIQSIAALMLIASPPTCCCLFSLPDVVPPQSDAIGLLTFASIPLMQMGISWGLFRFWRPARWAGLLVCMLWLLFFPVGTCLGVICGLILTGRRVGFVFSDQYQQIILDTPQYQTNSLGWLWLWLPILLLAQVALLWWFFATR